MNDFSNNEVPNLSASFAQLGSDATRRLCEQSQGFASAINDWNTEAGQFLSHRVIRNLDTIARMTRCGNLQEAFSIQAEWFRDTADDYARELGKLMEANGKIVSNTLRPIQEAAERSLSPSATLPMKVSA